MFAEQNSEPWLADLNAAQRSAALHDGGPLLVIAGAGTGKTRTLAARVARLIADGVEPDRILLLTFTRRAAADMLRRVGSLTSRAGAGRVWGGTFHSIANRILRRRPSAVGLRDGFTVLDQTDCEALFGIIRTNLGFGETSTRFPRRETVAAIYSRVANAQTKLTVTLDERFPWCRDHADPLREIFTEYVARKRAQNVVDYDDLLLYWRALLDDDAGATITRRFDHVLVDEYQDTNRIQADILSKMSGPTGNLTVVGDDAQAIYSFRAAEVDNILEFPAEYPTATVVTLEQNYRSTPEILTATNRVITAAPQRFPKRLWSTNPPGPRPALVTCTDPSAEADYVCDALLERREEGVELRDQAVLFRTGHHSDALELELSRRHIPFVKFGGLKFLETAHVKDLLAMLRVLDNPDDDLAWHRVFQSIPGIGPATALRLIGTIRDQAAADPIAAFVAASPTLSRSSVPAFHELQTVLGEIGETPETTWPPAAQIDRLLGFCEMVFPAKYDDASARLGDLESLRIIAAEYRTRSRFLTELALDPPSSTSDLADSPHLDDDYVILSTIHSAKGGEWDTVYVLHAADGNIPSDLALSEPGGVDEERRVFYVALTRAKRRLHVTVPQRFYHHRNPSRAEHSYALPSRFLDPARPTFDVSSAGVAEEPQDEIEMIATDPVTPVLDALWE